MKMEVWRLLSTIDAVVLKREYSERLISLHKRFSDPLCGACNGSAFFVGEIE